MPLQNISQPGSPGTLTDLSNFHASFLQNVIEQCSTLLQVNLEDQPSQAKMVCDKMRKVLVEWDGELKKQKEGYENSQAYYILQKKELEVI